MACIKNRKAQKILSTANEANLLPDVFTAPEPSTFRYQINKLKIIYPRASIELTIFQAFI